MGDRQAAKVKAGRRQVVDGTGWLQGPLQHAGSSKLVCFVVVAVLSPF